MSPDVIARAFDPFFTTKGVGKGTGLASARSTASSGSRAAMSRSTPNSAQGTTVKLYLPRSAAEAAPEPAQGAARVIAVGAARVILVVEDEERVAPFTVGRLQELGYTVVEAARPAKRSNSLMATGRSRCCSPMSSCRR